MTYWNGQDLLAPITDEEPCGKNLEDTEALGAFDAYQIFGQTTLEPAPREAGESARREPRKSDRPPNWNEIRDLATETLHQTKDLRLLAHLGTALLRTEGFEAFSQALHVASAWLNSYWTHVYPLVEEDGIFRRNALNCFADPIAVVDGVRRVPLVSSRQHGRFCLRDVDIAAGLVTPTDTDLRPDETQIGAAFADMPIEELQRLSDSATGALESVLAIDAAMRREVGVEAAPSFDPLSVQLKRMQVVLKTQLARHPNGAGATTEESARGAAGDEVSSGTIAVGAIKSRQDAIRALDAAAEFFRRNEPSSPVPLFVERAKRLIAKDFLEVLADVAPDALPQARAAGGIREE